MENLEQLLQGLPKESIVYTQKTNEAMNIPYQLEVQGYKKMYLNGQELPDLNAQEQLILLCATGVDPYTLPSNTVAGIFKAREIMKRSQSVDDAISKCNQALIDINKTEFEKRSEITEEVSRRSVHANLLEYYLGVERAMADYEKQQASIFAPFINLKNRIVELVTRKPHVGPPYSRRRSRTWKT